MKRMMAILVLVVAVPAMAVVNFTATDAGSQKLTIAYTTTDGDLPRGVAIRISLSDGAMLDFAAPVVVDAAFNTFIDWAYSNPLNYQVGNGNPLALATAAGALTADAADFSISMGVLDQTGKQLAGPASATLITIQLKGIADGGQTTVTCTGDTLRGPASGVVGSVLTSNLPQTVVVKGKVVPTDCVKTTASFYNDWVAFGKPNCWCYERQCNGDIDGKKFPNSAAGKPVTTADLTIFKAAFNLTTADLALVANGICADLNHAKFPNTATGKRVTTADLTTFKLYFNVAMASVPSCDISNYNFWMIP